MLINHSNYYLLLLLLLLTTTTACLFAYRCLVSRDVPGPKVKGQRSNAGNSLYFLLLPGLVPESFPGGAQPEQTGTQTGVNRVRRGPVIIHHSVRRISNKSLNDSADVTPSYNMTSYPDSSPSPNTEQPNLCFPPASSLSLLHYYTIILLLLYYCHTVRIPIE